MKLALRSVALLLGAVAVGSAGCDWVRSDSQSNEQKRADADKTRDEVAKATERAKPELEEAGREIKDAARTAAEQARAAAQGVKDGWQRGDGHKLNLNTAKEDELVALPGITRRDAHRIEAGRPYSSAHQLVEKGIIGEDRYREIRDRVDAS